MMNTIVKTREIIEKVPMLPRQSALWIAQIKGKPPRSMEGERERERETTNNCYPIVPGGKSARNKKDLICMTEKKKQHTREQ